MPSAMLASLISLILAKSLWSFFLKPFLGSLPSLPSRSAMTDIKATTSSFVEIEIELTKGDFVCVNCHVHGNNRIFVSFETGAYNVDKVQH